MDLENDLNLSKVDNKVVDTKDWVSKKEMEDPEVFKLINQGNTTRYTLHPKQVEKIKRNKNRLTQ